MNAEGNNSDSLVDETRELLRRDRLIEKILAIDHLSFSTLPELLALVVSAAMRADGSRGPAETLVLEVFQDDHGALDEARRDIAATAAKNFEPGGEVSALLFSRGVHALLAHRVSHSLWRSGRRDLALALKTIFGRVFSTDIHPAARIGGGVWLDHGLGFVVGETAVIDDDVSIWHGVTLGSTLKDDGAQRHPRIRRGATIGADSVILGGVTIGEGSVVAAGSVVLVDVAPHTTVAGVPARERVRDASSFVGF